MTLTIWILIEDLEQYKRIATTLIFDDKKEKNRVHVCSQPTHINMIAMQISYDEFVRLTDHGLLIIN